MDKITQEMGNLIFALDIGTRSVIGLLVEQSEESIKLLDMEVREHPKRAMIDGQIEDVEQVAKVATKVKQALEERNNVTFTSVCVAAAGRALKTQKSVYEKEFETVTAISAEHVTDLEMCAIEQAHKEASVSHGVDVESDFYCVGHSVMRYFLDDYPLSTLIHHSGRRIRVELIATFLPKEVVESLYTSMRRIGLEVENLTLEPIAAMNAIIPSELRMLNLALVDIGAGTSDIAICNQGSVIGYTMATIAGDEVTDAIISKYLVDFDTAERIKHEASMSHNVIGFTDILGVDYTISAKEVIDSIAPVVNTLSATITQRILECNESSPKAIFLVGGGSKAPGLREKVAADLEIDLSKVAVGGSNYMKRLVSTDIDIAAPELATPIGIALTSASVRGKGAYLVTINGVKANLFRSSNMPMMDILLMNGYNYSQIIGKTGRRITCTVNGTKRIFKGGYSTPAYITLNGEPANISAIVSTGDHITITPAVPGEDATPHLSDAIRGYERIEVTLNGEKVQIGTLTVVNGVEVDVDGPICEGDVIETETVKTVIELLKNQMIDPRGKELRLNGELCELRDILKDGDELICSELISEDGEPKAAKHVSSVLKNTEESVPLMSEEKIPEATKEIDEEVSLEESEEEPDDEIDDEPIVPIRYERPAKEPVTSMPKLQLDLPNTIESINAFIAKARSGIVGTRDQEEDDSQTQPKSTPKDSENSFMVRINDEWRSLPIKPTAYLFLDMLNYVDIDPTRPQGDIILRLNSAEAAYLDEVHEGDDVQIRWKIN